MKWKKTAAFLLAGATIAGSLFGCVQKTNAPENTAATETESTEITEPPVKEDDWVNEWYEDIAFEAMVDDEKKDTKGTSPDGYWLDSFSSVRNAFWTGNESATVENRDGKLILTCSDNTNEAFYYRSANGATDFIVETRIKVDHFGSDNGFCLNFGDKRVVVYLLETKIRLGMERILEGYPRPEMVYTNVGSDWHTYRVVVRDSVAMLYLDGVYQVAFECEPGSGGNRFSLFACPNYPTVPTIMEVEYVSYQPITDQELTILSPARGETVGTGTATVTATASAGSGLSGTIQWKLNGVNAGESTVEQPTVTFENLTAGVYRLTAACGDTAAAERIFVVAEAGDEPRKEATYSTQQALESSYILRFTVDGAGSVTAGDGLSPLRLSFNQSAISYETADGEQKVWGGTGDYIAVVDGGVAWIYRNGKMLCSFILPYRACEATATVAGNVSGLVVAPHNGTFWSETFQGAAKINRDIGNLGFNFCMEFEYTKGNRAELVYSDGAYLIDLDFAEDGTLTGVSAPARNAVTRTVSDLREGTALYRVYVSAGIAMIYCNNAWIGSWRLPETSTPRNFFLSGNGFGRFQFREINDKFFYRGAPTDDDWNQYFSNSFDTYGKCLKLYSKDTEITAELTVPESGVTGAFYLAARYGKEYTNEGLFAGYDFSEGCWRVGGSLNRLEKVSGTLPAGNVVLKLTVIGQTVQLFCNGNLVLTHDTVVSTSANLTGSRDVNGWGYAGYYHSAGANVVLRSFAYEGDGSPLKDTTTIMIPDQHTVCMFELPDGIYMCSESGSLRSTDGGYTFTGIEDIPHRNINMLVLQSGNVLTIHRTGTNSSRRFVAYISSDGCKTFKGPYPINEDVNAYRTAMNGKVMQSSSGRIFFVSGETEDEANGALWIYYSDNGGVLWKKSRSEFNYQTTGLNIQEGSVVELGNGLLRMYARTDSGFLLYSESTDNGKTWTMDLKESNFVSVVSAFNVTKDAATGAIYFAWEYNNICDSEAIQYPRTRVGLAVSYDNAATWQYLGDIDELNKVMALEFTHWNIGVWTTQNHVYVTVGKMLPPHSWLQANGKWYNYTVRIGKNSLQPMARFNGVHGPFSNPLESPVGADLFVNQILAISSSGNRVYASGNIFETDNINGTRTEISAEMIAAFLNGQLTAEGNSVVIRVGNNALRLTAGSTAATFAGEEKTLTFAPVERNGSVWITVKDLCDLCGVYARESDRGAIYLTASPDAVREAFLLSQVGIW